MAQQENKIQLSKKGKREISPFIGHELLYDYLCGMLDDERKAAVENHVKHSRDAQLDLQKIQNGEDYAQELSATVVSHPIIEQINMPSTYLSVLMQKSNFDKWPQGLKWGLEALVVVAVIVTLLTVAPWQKVLQLGMSTASKDVVLAEATKAEKKPDESMPPVASAKDDKPEFVDEDAKTAKPLQTPVKADAKVAAAGKAVPGPSVAPAKAAAAVAAVAATKPVEAKPAEHKADIAKNETHDDDKSDATTGAGGGFLYRGSLDVTNIEVIGPKITDKILELGGRKAGAVELGWKKTENSMYYHFTIPEAKYQDLSNFLATYGKARISKEKHPRVMPDGIIRLILTVDEAAK